MKRIRNLWTLLKEAFIEWRAKRAQSMAAALSFYAVYSAAPMILIIAYIMSFFFRMSESLVFDAISPLIGKQGTNLLGIIVLALKEQRPSGLISILGVLFTIFGATRALEHAKQSLNIIFGFKHKEERFFAMIKKRFYSFSLVILLALFLVLVIAANSLAVGLGRLFSGWLFYGVSFIVSLGSIVFFFAVVYRYIPDQRLTWRQVMPGASFTAFIFIIGQQLFGMFLVTDLSGTAYGVAGSILLFLIWMYYSAQIFLFGAAYIKVSKILI